MEVTLRTGLRRVAPIGPGRRDEVAPGHIIWVDPFLRVERLKGIGARDA